MKHVITEYVENITGKLISLFLEGADFSIELAEKIHHTFDLADTVGYYDHLPRVKYLLTNSKRWSTDEVFIIDMQQELSVKETAVVIRYINMVYTGGKNIIVINGKIVYVGEIYSGHASSDIEVYVDNLIKDRCIMLRRRALKNKLLAPFRWPAVQAVTEMHVVNKTI